MARKLWREAPLRPYRARPRDVTSAMMSAVKGRENRAERLLRKLLWHRGYRYRLYSRTLPGRPDIILVRLRTAIFVDGDFWHGRALVQDGETAFRRTLRTDRQDWWVEKLRRTVERDRYVTAELKHLGWLVIRVWEGDVLAKPEQTARRVATRLRKRQEHIESEAARELSRRRIVHSVRPRAAAASRADASSSQNP
jgi:DNA mismatch endonuclease (patch repair protein)